MKKTPLILLAAIAIFTLGCAVKQAQNAQEFRQMIPHDSYGHHESVTIPVSFAKALKNVKKGTQTCLGSAVMMTTTNQYGQTLNQQKLDYTPTLTANKKSASLSVQMNISGGGMIAGKVPDKGMFILVADLKALSKNSTQLTTFRNSYYGAVRMEAAVKDWAAGKKVVCPNMSNQ